MAFRVVFKMWPVVLGAVLFGLAIRLTIGPAPASDDHATVKLELGDARGG